MVHFHLFVGSTYNTGHVQAFGSTAVKDLQILQWVLLEVFRLRFDSGSQVGLRGVVSKAFDKGYGGYNTLDFLAGIVLVSFLKVRIGPTQGTSPALQWFA